ncbi:MAG TPA: dihydroorotate dehydrogenase electron transfer subunit [Bacteroidota bacterium]|nr:dihydroorotate dehydrogenase electron transfer subunit [Bacteroidota bacterium]
MAMILEQAPVRTVTEVGSNVFQLTFSSLAIAREALPGQFVNVKTVDGSGPLLRRPFSISSVRDDEVSILFNVIGSGTKALSLMRKGEGLDVLGPLGKGTFPLDDDAYETALIVAGGLGVAPMPFLRASMPRGKKQFVFLGARSASQVVTVGLEDAQVATDDGSKGFHGTVVDLLRNTLVGNDLGHPRIFACGPLPMLRSLRELSEAKNIECYVALECEMACGIGLCQGCPVESSGPGKKYRLVCNEGPVFNALTVVF